MSVTSKAHMRKVQIYLDDELWTELHRRSREEKVSISELARRAARDRYVYTSEQRQADLMAAVGLWKDRTDLPDTETYIRNLRNDTRLKRLGIV